MRYKIMDYEIIKVGNYYALFNEAGQFICMLSSPFNALLVKSVLELDADCKTMNFLAYADVVRQSLNR